MMHILDLNDDCLAYICQFLELDEQLTVKQVCMRLDHIIRVAWRQQRVITLPPEQLATFEASPADFVDLFSSAKHVLQEVHLNRVTSQQLQLLQHLTFSNVKLLECSNWQDDVDSNDQDMQLLVKSFPAIQTLVLLSNITGKHISSLRHLVHLDVSCCADLKLEYLVQIYQQLKLQKLSILFYDFRKPLGEEVTAISACSTLEELRIEDFHLLRCIDVVLQMPCMRRIQCYSHDHDELLMSKIVQAVGPKIISMVYCSLAVQQCEEHLQSLLRMTNLQRLVIYEDGMKNAQVLELAMHLRYLREFHFIGGCLENDDSLLYIIQYCKYLEILNVSYSSVGVGVLKKIIELLNANERTQVLTLYCICTEIAHVDLQDLVIPAQLKIRTNEPEPEFPEGNFFECEWLPKVL